MSRIGKIPVAVPAGVEVSIEGQDVRVKGPKGELSHTVAEPITVSKSDDGSLAVERPNDERRSKALHGLSRTLISNMVVGVTEGYEKKLEIVGVGYKAQAKGKSVTLNLGHSHPIEYKAPAGIDITQDEKNKNILIIKGIDKATVGQAAADIRAFRPPEPYKGKGVRYIDEVIVIKPGKAAAGAAGPAAS